MNVTIYKPGEHEFIFTLYLSVNPVLFLYFRSFADIDYFVAFDNHCAIS